MPIQNGERLVTKQDLADMYQGILPYLGGMPEMLANKFSKGDLYSTDEKMIGQWIDSKPLYQKTIDCGALPNKALKTVSSGLTNVTVLNIYGVAIGSSFVLPMPNITDVGAQNGIRIWYDLVNNNVCIDTQNSDRSALTGYATIRYTKVSDTAISIGSDTDYSTEEKIVGTWIDSKPIYQRTLNLGTLSLSTSVTHEDIDVATWNIDTLIDCKGGGIVYKGSAFQGNVTFPQNYINDLGFKVSIKISTSGELLVIYKTVSSSGTFTLNNAFLTVQYTKAT